MKKLLIACLLLSGSIVQATDPERVETLSSKIVLHNTNGYFVLSDKSCWKVIAFSKRWRSLSEWWNNVQLIPKHYECLPNDWYLGTQIEVYPKAGNLEVDEANAANQELLKQCTHILYNSRTEQVLFAIALEPADCIMKLFTDAHAEGFDKGYSEGRSKGTQNSIEIYNNGHTDGYRAGYAEGYEAAIIGQRPPS
ncbi:MAG: hypothetical protein ACHQT8_04825 [Chlamydiales bacterium]